jgi:hypothetical protein
MRGAFNHNFDPYWSGAIYGEYAQLKYGDAGKTVICAALAGTPVTAGVTTFNPSTWPRSAALSAGPR